MVKDNKIVKTVSAKIKWTLYFSIAFFTLGIYAIGRSAHGITSISTHEFMKAFLHNPFSRFSYFMSNGFESDGGEMTVIGIIVYIVHLVAGVSFGRGKMFVFIWLILFALMNIINLVSLF